MNRNSNTTLTPLPRDPQVEVRVTGSAAPGAVLSVVGSRSDAVRLAGAISALAALRIPQATAQATGSATTADVYDADWVPDTRALASEDHAADEQRMARLLAAAEPLLRQRRPRLLVVTGDGDAGLAFSLAASKLGVEIVRVGAGLRTGDFSQPEEINRLLGDRLADVLFTDAFDAADALESEGIAHDRIRHVGNPAIDLLRRCEDSARALAPARRLGLPPGGYVLTTLHRAENTRDEFRLVRIADALCALAERMPVVLALHPATRARLDSLDAMTALRDAGVRIAGPLGYLDFLSLQQSAGAILTDSGGVQDEASALGVRCYTLRRATERVLTLIHGTNVLLGDDPAEIAEVRVDDRPSAPAAIPLWDGRAGERIAAELSRRLTLELAS